MKRKTIRKKEDNLRKELKQHSSQKSKKKPKYEGNFGTVISTGSTLLDLAISGGRVRGGGMPTGIMVVAYGPSSTGKTVMACEFAGAVQRLGGEIDYGDSEGRLNKKFAEMFDLDMNTINYSQPEVIPDAFKELCNSKKKEDEDVLHAYIVDSLAALSTTLEMENEEGDKMGGRRAKEFSMYLRKSKLKIAKKNKILFCTNQIRENMDGGAWSRKDVNPGGKAIEFYASLILRFTKFQKIKKQVTIRGEKVKRSIGINGIIEVDKSSIWKPHREAPITILFDYGIDDIRENLEFCKKYSSSNEFQVGDVNLGKTINKAIQEVEEQGLEKKLKEQTIDLWEEIESKFEENRKPKKR